MNFSEDRFIDDVDAYSIYRSVRLDLGGRYNLEKYGLYPKKFIEGGEERNTRVFQIATKTYQTEYRFVCACASNLVIDPQIFPIDFVDESYLRLRRYNTGMQECSNQFKDLLSKYTLNQLLSSDALLLHQFIQGVVSPELFSSLLHVFDLDSSFQKSKESYVWELIKPRISAYIKYVLPNADKKALASSLATIIKST